jgi:hypothetical protein
MFFLSLPKFSLCSLCFPALFRETFRLLSPFRGISCRRILADFTMTSHVFLSFWLLSFFSLLLKLFSACATLFLFPVYKLFSLHHVIALLRHVALAFFVTVRILKSSYCFQTLSIISSLSLLLLSESVFTLFMPVDLILEMIPSWHWSLFFLLFHCLFPQYPFSIPLLPPDLSFQEISRHSLSVTILQLPTFENLFFLLFLLFVYFVSSFYLFFTLIPEFSNLLLLSTSLFALKPVSSLFSIKFP